MAKHDADNKSTEPEKGAADASAPYVTSEKDKAKARKWFERAAELANGKSWDFAIKCYVDGLAFWPEAVEEAHQPLRAAAAARNLTGGKKPGFSETMKYSMTGKDAKKAMLNAEWLLSHDPFNLSYAEGVLKNANKLRAHDTIMWIGPIYANAIEKEKKPNPKRFALLREVYEETGDRCANLGQAKRAVECYQKAVEALNMQKVTDPKDLSLVNQLRDLSTKLTILKGKYESADTFQESMRDADDQKDLQNEERMIKGDDSLQRLIDRAKADVEENPDNQAKVRKLVELLCSRDDQRDENRAIKLLVDKFKTYGEYGFKVQAEDIHARQLKRAIRRKREAGDVAAAQQLQADLLAFEIKAFRGRIAAYPTNNRLKYDLAMRLFQMRKFDDAIPNFQAARADAKVRVQSDLYLGRCFYEKQFGSQAIGILSKAADAYEIPDDNVAKELRYWLGRAYEMEGKVSEARDAFGQILQMDYNFRDVRDRLESLRSDD